MTSFEIQSPIEVLTQTQKAYNSNLGTTEYR